MSDPAKSYDAVKALSDFYKISSLSPLWVAGPALHFVWRRKGFATRTFSSPPKMFFTWESRHLAGEKNILDGEEKVSSANCKIR